MTLKLKEVIMILTKNVEIKLPIGFEKKYYDKMCYSSNNVVLDLDEKLLRNTIAFEVAFIHVSVYILVKLLKFKEKSYSELLNRIDKEKFFSWYVPEQYIIDEYLEKIDLNEDSNIHSLINGHDKLIDKDIKKKLGQFYTPINISRMMIKDVKNSLKNVMDEDTIVDPACGVGIFIVEAIRILEKTFQVEKLIEYINKNIYAFDVNPFAIIATKINIIYELYLYAPSELKKINEWLFNCDNLFQNILLKNTIVEDDSNEYSIILGNPPYFKMNKKLIRDIKGYEEILYGQPNIYSFFMYWGITHIKKDGVMSFIVPQSIRSGLYFKKLRAKLYSMRIKSIIYIDSRQKVFDRAEQAVLIICLENKPVRNTKTKIKVCNGKGLIESEFKISRSKIMMSEEYNNIFVINKEIEMYDILDRVYLNSLSLDKGGQFKFSNGLFVWNQHKEDIVDYKKNAIPIIYGSNIQSLKFNFKQCSHNKERKQFANINNRTEGFVLSGKRLLVQRTTNFEKDIRLKACIISDEFLQKYKSYLLENHVNFLGHISGKDFLVDEKKLYYYLGMLNSKLLNYIFISKSGNTQVSANELNALPFPINMIDNISDFVKENLENLNEHQDELDRLVCEAYGLSEEQINYIVKL